MHPPEHQEQVTLQASMLKGHKNAVLSIWIVIHKLAENQN